MEWKLEMVKKVGKELLFEESVQSYEQTEEQGKFLKSNLSENLVLSPRTAEAPAGAGLTEVFVKLEPGYALERPQRTAPSKIQSRILQMTCIRFGMPRRKRRAQKLVFLLEHQIYRLASIWA